MRNLVQQFLQDLSPAFPNLRMLMCKSHCCKVYCSINDLGYAQCAILSPNATYSSEQGDTTTTLQVCDAHGLSAMDFKGLNRHSPQKRYCDGPKSSHDLKLAMHWIFLILCLSL